MATTYETGTNETEKLQPLSIYFLLDEDFKLDEEDDKDFQQINDKYYPNDGDQLETKCEIHDYMFYCACKSKNEHLI